MAHKSFLMSHRGKIKSKVALANQPSLNLDVTCSIQSAMLFQYSYICFLL